MSAITMSALGVRDRRALRLGALVLGLAVAARLFIPALERFDAVKTENQIRADALARAALRPSREALADSLARVMRQLDSVRTQLLPTGSSALVASNLHAAVRRAASDVGLTLHGSRAEADSLASGPFGRATVQVDAEGDVSNLMQFLLLLEMAPGQLQLTQLVVTPLEPAAQGDRPEVIRVSLSVEGIAPRRAAPGTRPHPR